MDACKHKHAHTVYVMDALFCDHYLWMKGSKISSRHPNLIFGSLEMNAAGRLGRTAGMKRSLVTGKM